MPLLVVSAFLLMFVTNLRASSRLLRSALDFVDIAELVGLGIVTKKHVITFVILSEKGVNCKGEKGEKGEKRVDYLVDLKTMSSSSLDSFISWSLFVAVLLSGGGVSEVWACIDVQGLNCLADLEENSHSSAFSLARCTA